eukprot:292481-Chlamydomonas_euryale.AAC.4
MRDDALGGAGARALAARAIARQRQLVGATEAHAARVAQQRLSQRALPPLRRLPRATVVARAAAARLKATGRRQLL